MTTSRRPPRAPASREDENGRRKRRRDDEVISAAVKVFYQRGYSDSTVQDVANELGILKGSLYHYIKTKEDLLFRVLESVHEDMHGIAEDVAARGGTPLGQLERYVRDQVNYNMDNIERISVYYHDMDKLTGERLDKVRKDRREHSRFVTSLIEAAQSDGSIESVRAPWLLSNCVFATIIWTYRWYRPGKDISKQDVADVCSGYALRGIGAT